MEEQKVVIYEELIGKIFSSVYACNFLTLFSEAENDTLILDNAANKYKFYHDQSCCEDVYIEDIVGNLDDLVGSPITMAECVTNSPTTKKTGGDEQWSFLKLATVKGYVTVRWYGESNGDYSTEVDFREVKQCPRCKSLNTTIGYCYNCANSF